MARLGHPNEQKYGYQDSASSNPSAPQTVGDLVQNAVFFWQPSSLSWVKGNVDASGNLNTTASITASLGSVNVLGGSITVIQGTNPWVTSGGGGGGSGGGSTVVLGGTIQIIGPAVVTPAQFGFSSTVVGQAAMASSIPVVIASNQTAVPASQSGAPWQVAGSVAATQGGTWNVGLNAGTNILGSTNVAGSVALLGGSATIGNVGLNAGTNILGSTNVGGSVALLAGAATIGNVGLNAGTNILGSTNVAGSVALLAGSASVGNVGVNTGTNTIGSVNVSGGVIQLIPSGAQTGLTPFKRISTADNNAANVKASAGQLYGWSATNVNAAARFLKFYNCGSSPAIGAAVPLITQVIPGNANGAGNNYFVDTGIAGFTSGIAIGITGAMPDTDNTSISANDVALTVLYK